MSAQLDHDQAAELLPWLINGTLAGAELDAVESHVRSCLACRRMLREQQQLQAAIAAQPTVPLSAEQGFDRLLQRMDAPGAVPLRRRNGRRFGLIALQARTALLAAAGLAAVGLAVWLAGPFTSEQNDAAYSTLSKRSAAASTDSIRLDLIFAKSVTEPEMRTLLNEIDAVIVGGPSDLGRYTVQLNAPTLTPAQVGELIERLARDSRIRFAGRSMMEAAQ